MWDLLVVAYELLRDTACGVSFPHWGWNPGCLLGSLSRWTTRENPTHFKKFLDIKCLSLHYDFTPWVCTHCCVTVHSLSRVWLFATPWTITCQAPLSMGFPRQEYWSGLPFFSPGDLPDPGVEPTFPALAGGFFTIWATREAQLCTWGRCKGGKWVRKLSRVKFWFSWCGILNPLLYLASGWKWKWVAQSCPTIWDPMDCNPPGSFVHGILQARVLEWVAIPFSRGSSQPRDWTQLSCIAGGFFTIWATLRLVFWFCLKKTRKQTQGKKKKQEVPNLCKSFLPLAF